MQRIRKKIRKTISENSRWLAALFAVLLVCGCGEELVKTPNSQQAQSEAQIEFENNSESQYVETSETEGEAEAGQQLNSETEAEAEAESETRDEARLSELEVHFIDVGQGDATLLICDGEGLLIDAGNNNKGTLVQSYIKKQGLKSLKYIIGTHPDADHIGGLDVIVTKFKITSNQVWMPDVDNDTNTYRDVIDAIKYRNLKKVCPKAGSTYKLGTAELEILAPREKTKDKNDSSIVIMARNGDNAFVFTGDASEGEESSMRGAVELQADVLKVGHHGSKHSTSQRFLDAVSPEYAVISVGDNSYGHPTAECLNRLRMAGVKLYRTDDQGSIIAVSNGHEITWSCAPSENWVAGEETAKTPEKKKSEVKDKDSGSASGDVVVYITKTGKKYHVQGCSYLKSCIEVTLKEAKAKGLTPCSRCNPPQ